MSIPSIVTTGSSALRSTCVRMHRRLGGAFRPRGAHVVLVSVSIMFARIIRT